MLTTDCYIDEGWGLLKKGDQGALLALYQQHYTGLINYGFKICGDKELSNDCIIKVLIRLWDDRETLPDVKQVRSYLMTCVRNEILHELKTTNLQQLKLKKLNTGSIDVELPYEEMIIRIQSDSELKKKLLRAFKSLSAREKELLQMKFYDDMDYDAIAAHCNITKRTAYNIIHGALKRLKNELHSSNINLVELYPALLIGLLFLIN